MGLVFKKAVSLDNGVAESYLSDGIDSEGGGIERTRSAHVLRRAGVWAAWILLDMAPIESPDPIAPAVGATALPYAVHYRPWQILNWREALRGGARSWRVVLR
jgi:hypothetical protein